MPEKIAVLGSSRGLGAALCDVLKDDPKVDSVLMISRGRARLETLQEKMKLMSDGEKSHVRTEILSADFSRENDQEMVLEALHRFRAERIVYVAGGGPHGTYSDKGWKDHLWAWQVSFLFAAKVLHWSLRNQDNLIGPRQLTLIGSSIAEDKADPGAASYSASKHALVGLYRTVRNEVQSLDLRLYSPGYMDTEMIPAGAGPRQSGRPLWATDAVARDLLRWLRESDRCGHRRLSAFPGGEGSSTKQESASP